MNINQQELNITGHWSSGSKLPESYGRAVCATELLLRNTIIQNFVSGWILAPPFLRPLTSPIGLRIGKARVEETPPAATLSGTGPSSVVGEDAQTSEVALTYPSATLEPVVPEDLGGTE